MGNCKDSFVKLTTESNTYCYSNRYINLMHALAFVAISRDRHLQSTLTLCMNLPKFVQQIVLEAHSNFLLSQPGRSRIELLQVYRSTVYLHILAVSSMNFPQQTIQGPHSPSPLHCCHVLCHFIRTSIFFL